MAKSFIPPVTSRGSEIVQTGPLEAAGVSKDGTAEPVTAPAPPAPLPPAPRAWLVHLEGDGAAPVVEVRKIADDDRASFRCKDRRTGVEGTVTVEGVPEGFSIEDVVRQAYRQFCGIKGTRHPYSVKRIAE